LDELQIHVVPVLLGSGTQLFDGLEGTDIQLEQTRVVGSDRVTHLRYSVVR
jgi:dihydrofolate reductase